ncbi:PHP domain-containing protein, partial [Primorskyibacter flagellatus]|uniref:PHP domain-containing protein n=1 Tax=Primorskyibacter flagellatus TaxID=1387277 RepID=UPI003A902B57
MIEVARDQRQAESTQFEAMLRQRGRAGYAELCVTTNFTFLTGASHPEELVLRAAELGLNAIAITDRNTLAGVVRAYSALKSLREKASQSLRVRSSHQVDSCSRQEVGRPQDLQTPQTLHLPKLIVGSRLVLRDCPVEWLALPTDRAAYHRLSRLLTLGKRRAEKAECHLDLRDLEVGCQGMILIALPPPDLGLEQASLLRLARRFPGAVFLGASPRYDGSDQAWFDACAATALRCSTPMVAVGDALMHHGKRRQLADVLTCLREGITIDQIGTKALPNAERRLKSASDMARLYRRHPAALKRTLEISARCGFDLSDLSYEYPDEMSEGETPQARLERLAHEGVRRRYPDGASERVHRLMDKELSLIGELRYAPYFLTVHDIVGQARARGILCQGRGSAANSILCYLLGITDVSPDMIGMVF